MLFGDKIDITEEEYRCKYSQFKFNDYIFKLLTVLNTLQIWGIALLKNLTSFL